MSLVRRLDRQAAGGSLQCQARCHGTRALLPVPKAPSRITTADHTHRCPKVKADQVCEISHKQIKDTGKPETTNASEETLQRGHSSFSHTRYAGERADFGPCAPGDWSAKAGAIATHFHPLIHTFVPDCSLTGCRPGQSSPSWGSPSPWDPGLLPRGAGVKKPTRSQVNLLEGKDREEPVAKHDEIAQHLLHAISELRGEPRANWPRWFWTDTTPVRTT